MTDPAEAEARECCPRLFGFLWRMHRWGERDSGVSYWFYCLDCGLTLPDGAYPNKLTKRDGSIWWP